MIRQPPISTQGGSLAASDGYKSRLPHVDRQERLLSLGERHLGVGRLHDLERAAAALVRGQREGVLNVRQSEAMGDEVRVAAGVLGEQVCRDAEVTLQAKLGVRERGDDGQLLGRHGREVEALDGARVTTQERDAGVMIIKAITKGPWGEKERTYGPWYEPYASDDAIEASVRFALSQPVTCLASAADVRLLVPTCAAAERFTPMSASEQADLIASRAGDGLIFEPI